MIVVFTLLIIAALAFVAAAVSYTAPSSPMWDAILVHSLYVLIISVLVLGGVSTVGSLSGLL